jgi:hypothetical protein
MIELLGKKEDFPHGNEGRRVIKEYGESTLAYVPGGSPGYLPKPPMRCWVVSRKRLLASKSIK